MSVQHAEAHKRDDRVLPSTRAVSALVGLILTLAFVLLYLNPTRTGELWAWQIRPNSTALFMGSGYAAGAYLFLRTAVESRWHRCSAPFLPIAAFTIVMMAATILHWDRFDLGKPAALGWVVLYVVSPFLVTWLWFSNQPTDPGAPEPRDAAVPASIRLVFALFGAILLLMAVVGFLYPPFLTKIWAWTLTPLTARVASGWMVVFGGGLVMAALDRRWSAWRVLIQTAFITATLLVIAALTNKGDFTPRAHTTWLSTLAVSVGIMAVFYAAMSVRERR